MGETYVTLEELFEEGITMAIKFKEEIRNRANENVDAAMAFLAGIVNELINQLNSDSEILRALAAINLIEFYKEWNIELSAEIQNIISDIFSHLEHTL